MMTTTAKALSGQAVLLPPEERLALVDRFLDTLDEPDQALDALWAGDAESRWVFRASMSVNGGCELRG